MTSEQDAPRAASSLQTPQSMADEPDAARTLRHELRTPVNHILGYGELLLEEVEGSGRDDVITQLTQIRAASKQALLLITDFFGPASSRLLPAALGEELEALTARIIAISVALRETAGGANDDLSPDLERIETAARHLMSLASEGPLTMLNQPRPSADEPGETPSVAEPVPATATDQTANGQRQGVILVVDDNAANRDVLARRLDRLGYAVVKVEHGRAALAATAATRFDLVLLDIMMPEMDGFEVLRRLKADEQLREIPVIVISALDELSSVVRCIELGAEDYLTKPFDPILLRARVGACVEKKRLRDQEVEYLRQVARVTSAAAAVETGAYEVGTLNEVAGRPDALGQLARIFEQMAQEVQAREQRLRQQVHELRIEIDRTRAAQQVAEITDSDYFRDLRQTARRLRTQTASAEASPPGATSPTTPVPDSLAD